MIYIEYPLSICPHQPSPDEPGFVLQFSPNNPHFKFECKTCKIDILVESVPPDNWIVWGVRYYLVKDSEQRGYIYMNFKHPETGYVHVPALDEKARPEEFDAWVSGRYNPTRWTVPAAFPNTKPQDIPKLMERLQNLMVFS